MTAGGEALDAISVDGELAEVSQRWRRSRKCSDVRQVQLTTSYNPQSSRISMVQALVSSNRVIATPPGGS